MGAAIVLPVRVSPGARREGVGGVWTDEKGQARLVVRVAAPPEDGRANKAVCAAVAAAFGLPKSAVAVTAGEKSRLKTLSVDVADRAAFSARLDALMREKA
jgi:uncharacterized protein (TIGR00251 family)